MKGDNKWHIQRKGIQKQGETSVEVMMACQRPPFLYVPSVAIQNHRTIYAPVVEPIVAEKL
jgi:hypothetical protein